MAKARGFMAFFDNILIIVYIFFEVFIMVTVAILFNVEYILKNYGIVSLFDV